MEDDYNLAAVLRWNRVGSMSGDSLENRSEALDQDEDKEKQG